MTGELLCRARIAEIHDEADGVKSFVLERPDGSDWPQWAPGAHVDLALRRGLNRQYSLCGDPADTRHLRFAVLREPASRGGSAMLHEGLRPGDAIDVVALRNAFPLVAAARTLLVAGGIGITPLLPMVRALAGAGADWHLLYGGRSRASMAFLSELAGFADRVTVCPQDETGLLDLAGYLGDHAPGTVAFCCGPEPLIAAVEAHCVGWPEEALQIERFHAKAQENTVRNGAFDVELRKSGLTLTVPADQTIADTLDSVGIHIPRSCNEGTCGTCLTKVLEGVPDHRDSFLRPKQREANNRILVCCSRALSDKLVLDA